MKLLTHNLLTSKCLKDVVTGYPLKLIANEFKENSVEFNPEFIKRLLPKMEYDVLRTTAAVVNVELPSMQNTDDVDKDEDFLKLLHHALLEIEIISGDLVCPETGRKFPIKNGIPNMLCNEEEV
ncbi:hypothetical protein SSS_02443 [Sarcoptes scabiei]|uniref:Multifunctional methyltransferase subunit TRM112-like protein n=1 Tax=Sarcoptes scabiei TaxID=52283 RepID=A0A834RH67_SARSC|nr:hypothetical protein SSS_02443 [Sarcoptes scabiei]